MDRSLIPYLIPLICTPIMLAGILINVYAHWENEPIIISKFFPDGEDLHLGTFMIFSSLGGAIIVSIIVKLVIPRLERKENREYRAGHTGTLPKDWGK